MAGKRAAQRYAKALLSLAQEKKSLDQVNADIRLLANTMEASKELRIVLRSPVIKIEDKRACLLAIFKDLSQEVKNLFEVLLANKRIDLLNLVAEAFIQFVDKLNHVITAEVTTALPLSPELEIKVREKIKALTGNDATLVQKIDQSILGGFLLRIDDLQYDASISGKLNSLQYKFKQNANL